MLCNAAQWIYNAMQCYAMIYKAMQCYAMLCNAVRCYAMPRNATHSYKTQWRAIHCLCVRRNVADTERPNGTRSWKSPWGCRPHLSQIFRAVDCCGSGHSTLSACPGGGTDDDGDAAQSGGRTGMVRHLQRLSPIAEVVRFFVVPWLGIALPSSAGPEEVLSSLYRAARSWHHTRVSY